MSELQLDVLETSAEEDLRMKTAPASPVRHRLTMTIEIWHGSHAPASMAINNALYGASQMLVPALLSAIQMALTAGAAAGLDPASACAEQHSRIALEPITAEELAAKREAAMQQLAEQEAKQAQRQAEAEAAQARAQGALN